MTARSSPPQPTLRQLRQARGWTQGDVARRHGVSPDAVSKWERGLAVPYARTHKRLADLFDVGVGEIAFGEGARP